MAASIRVWCRVKYWTSCKKRFDFDFKCKLYCHSSNSSVLQTDDVDICKDSNKNDFLFCKSVVPLHQSIAGQRLENIVYKLMKSSHLYSKSIFQDNDFGSKYKIVDVSVTKLLDKFKNKKSQNVEDHLTFIFTLANLPKSLFSDITNFNDFWSSFQNVSAQLSIMQLHKLLEGLIEIEINIPPKVFYLLDSKSINLTTSCDWNHKLYLLDLFYHLPKKPKRFLKELNHKANTEFSKLTIPNIIQLMFYFSHYRLENYEKIFRKFESKMLFNMALLTNSDLSILCHCYYKERITLTSKNLLSAIALRGIKALEENNYTMFFIISILKMLQFSAYENKIFQEELMKKLITNEIKPENVLQLTYFSSCLLDLNIYHEKLLQVTADQTLLKLLEEIEHLHESFYVMDTILSSQMLSNIHPSLRCRVKDLSSLLHIFSHFGYSFKNDYFCEVFIKIIQGRKLISEFEPIPSVLVFILYNLVILGKFSFDLINFALNPNHISVLIENYKDIIHKDSPLWQTFFLNQSVIIEYPEYNGHLLTLPMKVRLLKYRPKIEYHPKGMSQILQACRLLFDSEEYAFGHSILPHFWFTDIEILLDVNKKPLPVIRLKKFSELNNSQNSDGKNGDLAWLDHIQTRIAVSVLDNSLCCKDSDRPLGIVNAKHRQLIKSRYHLVIFYPSMVNEFLMKSVEDRIKMINFHLQDFL